jgi:hypothetical protein
MRFIVVPKNVGNGRQTLYEVIDTAPCAASEHLRGERARIGAYADRNFAEGLARTLTDFGADLDASVEAVDKAQAF